MSRTPPPPFSASFEASLLQPLPPLPPLTFDPLSFILTEFPSSPSLKQSGHYSGLVVQMNRAISGLSKGKAVKADDSDDHSTTLRSIGGMCEVCCELLESVNVMRELEDEKREREREQRTPSSTRTLSAPATPSSPSPAQSPPASGATTPKRSAGAAPPGSPPSSSSTRPSSEFQALDALAAHLVLTIRSLRSLSLLISSIDTLPLVLPSKDYPMISRLLAYITRLSSVLSRYSSLPILTTLRSHLAAHLLALQRLILFDLYTTLPALSQQPEASIPTLTLCVSLLDSYTPDVKPELISWFCTARLAPFSARCSTGGFGASIDAVEELYKWLYAELTDYELEQYDKIFPPSWYVPASLVRRWVDIALQLIQTRLADLTERAEKVDLYKPLQATMALEDYLVRAVEMEKEERDGVVVNRWDWKALLSSVFMPYIHTFVVFEQERLSKALDRIDRDEQYSADEVEDGQRLGGFDRLLVVVAKSLDKYKSLIHNETMFGLFKEYRRVVLDYCKLLERRIPNASGAAVPPAAAVGPTGPGTGAGGPGSGVNIVLTKQEVSSIILILNTADYVLTRLPSLAASVTAAVDGEYQPHVSFAGVEERVAKVHTKACSTLSLSLCNKLDPVLLTIKDGKRDMLAHTAGEESAFVKQLVGTTRREIARLVQLSSYPAILQAFLSRFCTLYVLRVKAVGHISDVFAEQLLTDTRVLQTALSSLPGIKQPEKDSATKDGKSRRKKAAAAPAAAAEKERTEEKEKAETVTKDLVKETPPATEERKEKDAGPSSNGGGRLKKEPSAQELKSNGASSASPSSTSPSLSVTSSSAASPMLTSSTLSATEPMVSFSSSSPPSSSSAASTTPSHPAHPSASVVAAALSSLQSDLSSTPITPSPPPPTDPYLTVIHHHLAPLLKQLTVLTSPTASFIGTFRRLFPKAPAPLLIELMDMRGITSRDQEKLVKLWNAGVGATSSKRVDWVQRDFMTNFIGDLKKTINTNL